MLNSAGRVTKGVNLSFGLLTAPDPSSLNPIEGSTVRQHSKEIMSLNELLEEWSLSQIQFNCNMHSTSPSPQNKHTIQIQIFQPLKSYNNKNDTNKR